MGPERDAKQIKHARNFIVHRIANGKATCVWHDLWLGHIPLIQQDEAKQLLRMPLEAKVSALLSNSTWNEKVQAMPQSEVKERILNTPVDHLLDEDYVVWTLVQMEISQ